MTMELHGNSNFFHLNMISGEDLEFPLRIHSEVDISEEGGMLM